MLNDLKTRGVEDILISCVDGLTGFPEAIAASFPKTEVQLCVIHQIRHSLKYIASKDQKAFMTDLKLVYQADTKDLAEHQLIEQDEKWRKKYPMVICSWQDKWEQLSTFFKYSKDIRRLIYTTNVIEGFRRQVRKYTKSKGVFTSESALVKLIYCACQRMKKNGINPCITGHLQFHSLIFILMVDYKLRCDWVTQYNKHTFTRWKNDYSILMCEYGVRSKS